MFGDVVVEKHGENPRRFRRHTICKIGLRVVPGPGEDGGNPESTLMLMLMLMLMLTCMDGTRCWNVQIFVSSREPHFAAMTLEVVKLALVGSPDATPPRQPPPDEDVLPAPKLLGTILQVRLSSMSSMSDPCTAARHSSGRLFDHGDNRDEP